MSPEKHILSGALLGSGIYLLTGKKEAAFLSFINSFICDTDHVLEYGAYCVKNKKRPDIKTFFKGSYFGEEGRIFIVFHGYEYLFIAAAGALIGKSTALGSAAAGYALHMILDTIGNDATFKGYLITYRLRHGWRINEICTKTKAKKNRRKNSKERKRSLSRS